MLEARFSPAALDAARGLVTSWEAYIKENKDEVTAIQLLYTACEAAPFRPAQGVASAIERPPRRWTPEKLWAAYERSVPAPTRQARPTAAATKRLLTDLVTLVRLALHKTDDLVPLPMASTAASTPGSPSRRLSVATFTPSSAPGSELIRDHVATSLAIEPDDFELSPFAQQGGLGRAAQLFGSELPKLLNELNEVLAA